MWPDQQPPGGAQNPQNTPGQNPGQDPGQSPGQNPYQQPGHQQPNPYQQPGYQQQPGPHTPPQQPGPYTPPPQPGQYPQQPQQPGPYTPAPQSSPYAQQPQPQPGMYGQQPQWGQPTVPVPQAAQGGGDRTKVIAIVATAAVVVTAAVTGYLVLGGSGDDEANGKGGGHSSKPTTAPPSTSSPTATDNPRTGGTEKPTIAGWKVVVNPKYGIAYDVPPDWEVQRPGVSSGFDDEQKGDGSAYIIFSGTADLKPDYCSSDSDKDGKAEQHVLAETGVKGENGAKSTDQIASIDSAAWAVGAYTDQSDAAVKKYLRQGKTQPFKTNSGIGGSIATSYVIGVPKKDKCDTDGKAVSFGFKNSAGNYVSWSVYGPHGVKDELPDATIKKILGTVRLHGDPNVE